MKKHVKNYMEHYGYGRDDIILCEVCGGVATDLHHLIFKSQGGSDEWDNIKALCRRHHQELHNITNKNG